MPWRLHSEYTRAERITAGLSYLTLGIGGIIYILFVAKGQNQSDLFRFHFIQSILLGILAMLLPMAAGSLVGILVNVLSVAAPAAAQAITAGFGFVSIAVTFAFCLLVIYGAVMAFMAKSAEVPGISGIVRQNLR